MTRRLAAALSVAALAMTGLLNPPGAAADVPFRDAAAVGTITLCDVRGHVATHGSIHTKPFVWRAVGSSPAPKPYTGTGRSAALYAYQPINGVPAAQWYGRYLTGTGIYSSATRPMAPATATDPSLADYLTEYPTKWDGLVELRLFVGASRVAPYTATYNAATIRVSGDSWTLVDGGHSGCDTGTSVSGELVLPEVRALGTPAANATTDTPARPGSRSTSPRGTSTPSAAPQSSDVASAAATRTDSVSAEPEAVEHRADTSSSGSSALPWLVGVIAALLLAGGAVWWRLRTTRAG